MIKMNSLAATVSLVMAVTPVLAQDAETDTGKSNFSYSTLGIQLGKVTLEEDLIFFGEVYEEFGAAAISGSVQLADNFAIGAGSSAFSNEGNRTEISSSSVNVSLFFPVPLGERVDLVPQVGYVGSEIEFCVDGLCRSDDDSAMSYGLATRIWAVPGTLELNLGVLDTNADDSEATTALGAAIWANENHRFAVDYATTDSVDTVLLGYRYNW